jgi:hypothetical protein
MAVGGAKPKNIVSSTSKPAAKPAAPTASKSAGGYSGIPATKTTTTGGYSGIPKTQTINLYGTPATNARPVNTPAKKVASSSIGGAATDSQNAAKYTSTVVDTAPDIPTTKTVVSRRPRLDSKGKVIGYDLIYSDGTPGFESNPDYKPEDEKTKASNVAYDTIEKILQSYRITGLASVLESIRDEYPEAGSDDILTLLQFDDRYNAKFNERFAANVKRQKAGKSVYSPGEYLALEQGFQKVFDSYNLPTFKNQSYYDKFIEGDVDVVDVTDRVQLAYDRVLSDG